MFAARSELINQKINNSSAEFVILDRYFHASVAYQGYGRGINLDSIYQLIKITECPTPSLTIILDIDVETGFKRKAADTKDRIESAGDDFFEKVRAGYLEIAKDHDYIKVVDADDDPEAIHQKIISLIEGLIMISYPWLEEVAQKLDQLLSSKVLILRAQKAWVKKKLLMK